jgi:RNA polymerase sigma-B factor
MTVLDAFDLAICDDAQLGRRAAMGDARARQELIERYLPLARGLALRYRRSGEPPDDLIQVASLALLKIVDRWDPEMGYAFSSYAMPTILGDLRHYFRDATWFVRPPRRLLDLSLVVESERKKFGAVRGREPTVAELAERLERPHAAVSAAVEAHASRVARSLDRTADDAEPDAATIADLIGHEDAGYERAEARTTIDRLTSILDPRARDVLRMRFQHDLRQWEIAAAIGCSQMQVCRIIRTSLERLSAHASMACGGWSMSDTTEGATA